MRNFLIRQRCHIILNRQTMRKLSINTFTNFHGSFISVFVLQFTTHTFLNTKLIECLIIYDSNFILFLWRWKILKIPSEIYLPKFTNQAKYWRNFKVFQGILKKTPCNYTYILKSRRNIWGCGDWSDYLGNPISNPN